MSDGNAQEAQSLYVRQCIKHAFRRVRYGGPQGSLHKKGHPHIKHCNLCKQKRLLQIKRELLQIKKDVGANKKSCCK